MIEFNQYLDMSVVVFCLVIGYLIKNALPINNKYIPLILAILGAVTVYFVKGTISVEILTTGMLSGLASTGFHQLLINFINNDKK